MKSDLYLRCCHYCASFGYEPHLAHWFKQLDVVPLIELNEVVMLYMVLAVFDLVDLNAIYGGNSILLRGMSLAKHHV